MNLCRLNTTMTEYIPDFVTNQYVVEVKGYARLADNEEYEYPDE